MENRYVCCGSIIPEGRQVCRECEVNILIIVNKEYNDAYNISHVVNIYMASDGNTIKAVAGTSTRGGILGKYKTFESARKAFEILMKRIEVSSREIVYMPTDDEVEREIKAGNKMHSINGKKQKGHGGS